MLPTRSPTPAVVIPFDASRRASARRMPVVQPRSFPVAAGVLLGLGLGGLFDGTVLQHVLQWQRLLTGAAHPAAVDTLREGVLHVAAFAFVAAGLALLWRAARSVHPCWSHRLLAGTMLIGIGAFSIVEAIVNHRLLGLHPGNQTVPHEQWLAWALLASGAGMVIGGWALYRSGRARNELQAEPAANPAARWAGWQRR
jgi:uncharacterized membrane protein